MTEKSFAEFVQQNLVALDELSREYTKYRFQVSQQYWDDLRNLIRRNTPTGYEFVDEKPNLSEFGEHCCGWSRVFEIRENSTTATVGFGFDSRVISAGIPVIAGAWHFMNNSCWTGVRIGVPNESEFLNIARQLVPEDMEPKDLGPVAASS